MIIIRTATINSELENFALEIGAASGEKIAFAVDERNGVVPTILGKVSVNNQAIESLGIYTPKNFAWMCGDYCLYLARIEYPNEQTFWLIENDVRISGNVKQFFEEMSRRKEDVLCAHLRPAEPKWWWYKAARGISVKPYRSLFPIGRYSKGAIDFLAAKRRRHSSLVNRRMLWPNDEAFVSTSIAHSDFLIGDINDGLQIFYTEQTLTYEMIKSEEDVPCNPLASPKIYHPVLSGLQVEQKLMRNAGADIRQSRAAATRRLALSYINSVTSW